jgi:tetratricopeptide (TPR) repeat protein
LFGLVLLAALPAVASAGVESRLPKVAKLRAEIDVLPPAERYAALRRLFAEWDSGDPAEVEEAVHQIGADAAQPAPVRTYAKILEGYGQRRRGDIAGAKLTIGSLGFVKNWMVVGPFDNEGKAGLGRAYEPEIDDAPAPGKSYDGKERKVTWRIASVEAPFGWIDTGALVRPTPNVCVYAAAFVRDPALKPGQSRTVSLFAGSAGAMRITFDGTVAIEDKKYRSFDAERLAANVVLRDGWVRVVTKTCGDESAAPIFALRIGDASGAPIKLDTQASPPKDIASRKPLPLPAQTVRGPLQTLEALAKTGGPPQLEALARYLVDTASDDPTDHTARDLAAKAADGAPTIKRLLLASELAENRNQAGLRIEKAETLVKGASDEDRIAVLLARAAHMRTSPNWRDAEPYYAAALAIDPDDVTAVLARVDLYQEAGLRHTAIAALEKAIARRPKSSLLLRALSAALRQEDRTTEADEVDERAAQLRFDDGAWIRQKLDLAMARRDKPTTIRWTERSLSFDPDNAERIATAARVYVSLGERPRAIALYKRALDLAPEDTDTMRALADVYALGGQQGEQITLLRKVLELRPQTADVREYLAHIQPQGARPDEQYARPPDEFLKLRDKPAAGMNRRTLVSLTVATVFPNGLASKFNQVVFQPLTDRAALEDRQYSFGFEADSQIVQVRGARVYHKDGSIEDATEMGESGNADSPEIAMYTSTRVYTVRMPRLSAGDVVEIRYRLEDISAHNAFADYFGDVNYLQSRDPISRAEYILLTPKSRALYFNTPSIPVQKTVEEKGDQRIFKFLATDVPGVEPEPNQPPYSEFLGHVHVSTYKSWEDVGRWYWGLVKDQFNADAEVRRRVAEITKGLTDERAKVKAIYDFVVQKTRYVALEFGIHGFKPYSCPQIFARGFGDCKDKATLIVTMLKEAGIPATIVIVRTGMKGLFEESPASLAPFDHAIAYVPSLDLYLDGTAEYTGSTELPSMDRGAMAMQVNEGNAKLVHLPDAPAKDSSATRKIEATVAADGSAQIDWRAEILGYAASSWRVRYHAEASRKQRLQEDLGSDLPSVALDKIETGKLDDVEAPVSVRAHGKVPILTRNEDGALSLTAGPREHLVREFAPQSSRKLDIRLGPRNVSTTEWTLHLPAGAKVTSTPKPTKVTSAFGSVEVTAESTNNTVKVTTTITMDKSRILASEYASFRKFCEDADRALGARVVFTK